MRAVIFGAGNIGRGLVGEALHDSGYSLTFVDVSADVVELLRREGGYSIASASARRDIPVERALTAGESAAVDAALADADLIATSVGAAALEFVAEPIAAGLRKRTARPVNVLACENVHPNSATLGRYVGKHLGASAMRGVSFPNCVVDRIAPGEPGALTVRVEAGFEFVVDATDWLGDPPDPSPIVFTHRLDDYKLRKLWMVNGLHALVAWQAVDADHEFVHEAMGDPAIRSQIESASIGVAAAIEDRCEEFDASALEAYRATTLTRLANHELPDLAVRVSRNPLIKLGSTDRIIPAALTAEKLGCDVSGFAAGIAAGLRLGGGPVAGADELEEALKAAGVEAFLEARGVRRDGRLHRAIADRLEQATE